MKTERRFASARQSIAAGSAAVFEFERVLPVTSELIFRRVYVGVLLFNPNDLTSLSLQVTEVDVRGGQLGGLVLDYNFNGGSFGTLVSQREGDAQLVPPFEAVYGDVGTGGVISTVPPVDLMLAEEERARVYWDNGVSDNQNAVCRMLPAKLVSQAGALRFNARIGFATTPTGNINTGALFFGCKSQDVSF